jgi:hypothetical protein
MLTVSLLALFALGSLMSGCHPGMMHDLLNPRPEGPFRYDCSPRPDDPEGYMVRICEYLNENQIWVGQFHTFDIDEVIETEEEGRPIIIILLSCCGTGDRAAIDKETGEVLYYSTGAW